MENNLRRVTDHVIGVAMAAPDLLGTAYCTACGSPMRDGRCGAECATHIAFGPLKAPPRGAIHTREERRVWTVLAVALGFLATVVASIGAFMAVESQRDLERVEAAVEQREAELGDLSRRLEKLVDRQALSENRLSGVEGEVEKQPNLPAIAKQASRSVYTVDLAGGTGSAFAVARSGRSTLLVTNFHVVAQAYLNGDRDVQVLRGDLTYSGTVTEVSESNDLAVITVPNRLPTLELQHRRPSIGESVLALGSPLGLGGTVTSGIVSAFRTEQGLEFVQFSAPISPGNSGGPLVDERGSVVGVSVAKFVGDGAEGLGFAIPTSRMCAALEIC